LGVKLTEQVPPPARVQLPDPLKTPVPLGPEIQATVPDGMPLVPTVLVSVTVAVHVVDTRRLVGFVTHTTLVPLVRWTVRLVTAELGW
jgi:hypothetical protein